METSSSSSQTEGSQSSRLSIYKSPCDRKKALRNVLCKTEKLQQETGPLTLHTLKNVFKEIDDIHGDATLDEKVSHQDQVVMDSDVVNSTSVILSTFTRSFTKECGAFSRVDFVEKLLRFVEQLPDTTLIEPNWSILENEIPTFTNTANYTSLSNWMNISESDVVPKVKKERKLGQRQRDPHIALRKPENVVQLEEEEKSIETTVSQIWKLITRSYKTKLTPIDFFQLILDPADFGKTIENLLHVSFLVRDGRIALTTDDNGALMVTPLSKEQIARSQTMGENDKVQNIISLDIEQWRILKDAYRITTPMINF